MSAANRRSRLFCYLLSALAVAATGLAANGLTQLVALPHVSVLFLAPVVASAALWGFWPSMVAAVLSIATGSYFFYSPLYSFEVAEGQDFADLAAFVMVAAFTSRLAAGVRAQALVANRRQTNIASLLNFSERLAESVNEVDAGRAILEHLAPVLGKPIHLLLRDDAKLFVAGTLPEDDRLPHDVLALGERLLTPGEPPPPGWRVDRLATAQGVVGVLVSQRSVESEDAEYEKTLLGQAAIALERLRLRQQVAEARVRSQGDALREALINSVSHDLHTPLAAILGSATALESFGQHGDSLVRRELIATIHEESERLSSYIDNVLDISRIRAGHMTPRLELVELSDVVNGALRRKQKALGGRMVDLDMPADLPMLRLDVFLMEHAVANVLDNATKYSLAGSALSIRASQRNSEVVLEVSDAGTGIAAQDLERVFEAFYRGTGPEGSPSPGSGLGLAICRAFVEANGGSVVALSAGPGGGTTLRLCLPVPQVVETIEMAEPND